MTKNHNNKAKVKEDKCTVCGKLKPISQLYPASSVAQNIQKLILHDHPEWNDKSNICSNCLNNYRARYVEQFMQKDLGQLDDLEKEVAKSLSDHEIISENINEEYEKSLSFGDRIADKVAAFGGSWSFIIWFFIFMFAWILMNTALLLIDKFDPYPFILLNLMLSLLAAIQAPIIMMSQNRQEDRDRMRAENDYQVNLKAEMEIRLISEKMDQHMKNVLEVQKIQMQMLNELYQKSD